MKAEETKFRRGGIKFRILELLNLGPLTVEEISKLLAVNRKCIGSRMSELRQLEYVEKQQIGQVYPFKTAIHSWRIKA